MDDDKTLLEKAAKAAGVPAYWSDDGTMQCRPMFVTLAGGGMGTMPYEAEWNPLKDDALALRLAVKLGLQIITSGVYIMQAIDYESKAYGEAERGSDPYAATRRAIVRAAAALGETHGSI